MNPWWKMVFWHYFGLYQPGRHRDSLEIYTEGKISPVSESWIPQDTDTMYSIYNYSWMAHVSDFGLVSNGSEEKQLLAPEACLAGGGILWKKKRGGFPLSQFPSMERKKISSKLPLAWYEQCETWQNTSKKAVLARLCRGSKRRGWEGARHTERLLIQNWRAGETADSLPDF